MRFTNGDWVSEWASSVSIHLKSRVLRARLNKLNLELKVLLRETEKHKSDSVLEKALEASKANHFIVDKDQTQTIIEKTNWN